MTDLEKRGWTKIWDSPEMTILKPPPKEVECECQKERPLILIHCNEINFTELKDKD